MKTKVKRVWTDEARKAAGDRMRAMQLKRWAQKNTTLDDGTIKAAVEFAGAPNPVVEVVPQSPFGTSEAPYGVVEKAVEEPITGEYKIGEQKVVFTPNHTIIFEKTPEEPIHDQTRVGSREVVLRVRTDGQMVSMQGPCLCGAVKRQWHQICLKQA